MAPELAIRELRRLKPSSMVLDPMAGSGTVIREAVERGHRAIGYDLDPLAVLMARVMTTPIQDDHVEDVLADVLPGARRKRHIALPWIDGDEETSDFMKYWFGRKQRAVLRRIAWAVRVGGPNDTLDRRRATDVLRVALSRIIVTKDVGASLGRDVSHSRPHRIIDKSTFDVLDAFERSVRIVRERLREEPPPRGARVRLGDARALPLRSQSVDLVLTSPPYLNAIDYLRGHRLSLIWLGYSIPELRRIRATAIGAERAPDEKHLGREVEAVRAAMTCGRSLPSRQAKMVDRYASDIVKMVGQVARTLRVDGRAVLVVGNSCLGGKFVRNSDGVVAAAKHARLRLVKEVERELPESRRYLPLRRTANDALSKRMRTETVLTFCRDR
jgi:SAM-dependent methyltransferase